MTTNLMIRIMVNNIHYCTSNKFSDILMSLMEIILHNITYMSASAIKDNILKSLEMVEEAIEENNVNIKDRNRIRRRIDITRKYLRKEISINVLRAVVTNTLLSLEGLGLLHGFSTPSNANPELMSMRGKNDRWVEEKITD